MSLTYGGLGEHRRRQSLELGFVMASAEREPITEVWGRIPRRSPGQSHGSLSVFWHSISRIIIAIIITGSGRSPLKLNRAAESESFFVLRRLTKGRQHLPLVDILQNSVIYLKLPEYTIYVEKIVTECLRTPITEKNFAVISGSTLEAAGGNYPESPLWTTSRQWCRG